MTEITTARALASLSPEQRQSVLAGIAPEELAVVP
jgi:hypothetical protein